MSKASEIVAAVLKELDGRGGFDSWWDDIDAETKADVVESLESVVEGELAKPKTGWGDSGPTDHNIDLIARKTRDGDIV